MFNDIYAGRDVFVTGHTGFKGSWLCAWLIALGARTHGFSRDIPTEPSNFQAMSLGDKLDDMRGDVRDKKQIEEALDKTRPEIVFHLAAQSLVRPAYEDPMTTFQTNMLGVLNILDAARSRPYIKVIVIITSDKCYKNEEWVWGYRETDRLGGADPYSASKACAEIIAQSYFQSFFQNGAACATARAGNVIGGGDWARDRIVPDCARAWAGGSVAGIRNPRATRPWQLALEPLSGYLWLAANLFASPRGIWAMQAYNFGPPADVKNTVEEVAENLARFWQGFNYRVAPADDAQARESGLLKLCCDKALADLDWKATLNFEETIRFTAEWYASYYAGNTNMWDYGQGQIAAYANLAQLRNLPWTK